VFLEEGQLNSTTPDHFINENGTTTWILRAGWGNAAVPVNYLKFTPENLTIYEGDRVVSCRRILEIY
jgi:hypothetical protein